MPLTKTCNLVHVFTKCFAICTSWIIQFKEVTKKQFSPKLGPPRHARRSKHLWSRISSTATYMHSDGVKCYQHHHEVAGHAWMKLYLHVQWLHQSWYEQKNPNTIYRQLTFLPNMGSCTVYALPYVHYVQWYLFWETAPMRDHIFLRPLSWNTALSFPCYCTSNERPHFGLP